MKRQNKTLVQQILRSKLRVPANAG